MPLTPIKLLHRLPPILIFFGLVFTIAASAWSGEDTPTATYITAEEVFRSRSKRSPGS